MQKKEERKEKHIVIVTFVMYLAGIWRRSNSKQTKGGAKERHAHGLTACEVRPFRTRIIV